MTAKVTVRLSDNRLYERTFSRRADADTWADQTARYGMTVVSVVSYDEPRDSEGAPLATCLGEQVQHH